MVVKCIEHMHITVELKAHWLLVIISIKFRISAITETAVRNSYKFINEFRAIYKFVITKNVYHIPITSHRNVIEKISIVVHGCILSLLSKQSLEL